MAGFYPDVPDNRIAYDAIGTQVLRYDSTPNTLLNELTPSDITNMNSKGSYYAVSEPQYATRNLAVLLPAPYDIDSLYYAWRSNGTSWSLSGFEWSNNSTNGLDGDWTSLALSNNSRVYADMRTAIQTVNLSGVTALRFRCYMGYGSSMQGQYGPLHLYGNPTATSNRLDFWDPTLDQAIAPAHFDWGDVARGSTNTLTYRIKNQSATLTANSIDISTEIVTDTTPSLPPMFEHSTDGTNFFSTINIGNLAPGAISGTLHVRKTLAADATLNLWWPRFKAAPGSWT